MSKTGKTYRLHPLLIVAFLAGLFLAYEYGISETESKHVVGDAVSTTTSEDRKDITVYTRDGVRILRRISYKSDDPAKRILRQQVFMGDTKIAEIMDFRGKQSCNVETNLPVAFGTERSLTGGLEKVVLMDSLPNIVEAFTVEDGCLVPISGSDLQKTREITKDVAGLMGDVKEQKKSVTELKAQTIGILIKHKLKEGQDKE